MKLAYGKYFSTPYQDYTPNFQGLFIPEVKSNYNKLLFKKNNAIHGGFIHAYNYTVEDLRTNKTEITKDLDYNERVYLKAYAFWTVALGFNDDLICKTLYVPQLDLTNRRDTRISMLENRYSKERLIKEFNLGHILGDY